MLYTLKKGIRHILPAPLLRLYHRALVFAAAMRYGWPSKKLIIIGITGTNGKSTTVEFISRLLRDAGYAVGSTSTVSFRVGNREWVNAEKMTMLGRFALQKLLRQMVDAGCRYAIIEMSSEGLAQYRHSGIAVDVAVFTNLTPEHIEAHGSFEAYRGAKLLLFHAVARRRRKEIDGAYVPRVNIVNLDDPAAAYFALLPTDRHFGYTTRGQSKPQTGREVIAAEDLRSALVSEWKIAGVLFHLPLPGRHNIENALAAICVGLVFGIPLDAMAKSIAAFAPVPGRLERIDAGQPFSVIVDYAPEPASLTKAFETVARFNPKRILHVLGSTGGGRDRSRRPILGQMSAEHAAVVIVTNEDPYDDDPQQIIDEVAEGARRTGKEDGATLFRIPDRRAAIAYAISLAKPGDLILITGKGSEPVMAVGGGKKVPWDDREVVRELLGKS